MPWKPIHHTTRKVRRDNARKREQWWLGVCRIRREETVQSRDVTQPFGFLVKDLDIFDPAIGKKRNFDYCLITTSQVIDTENFTENYSLEFQKLNSKKKIVQLNKIVDQKDFLRIGNFVFIGVKPSKKYSKKESIFTYRPFQGTKVNQSESNDLKCVIVGDKDKSSDVINFQMINFQNVRNENRMQGGVVILHQENGECSAVGCLDFADDGSIIPFFFPSSPTDGSQITNAITAEGCSEIPSDTKKTRPQVIGRSEELEKIINAIGTESVAAVLITGGPGFGKTAVATEVKNKLKSNRNEERTVLFCSLRSKETIAEVATSMILSCRANLSQPPDHPQYWLKNWSTQQQRKVCFILDNADHVLESDDRTEFISILRDMRILSNMITFVITSRREFQLGPNLQMKLERLTILSCEHAQELLLSKVLNPELKQGLSKTDKLAQLCGCVPLALCIIGSLLPDHPEDQLIECLEKKPLNVLKEDESDETDENSVEKAIYTSFNFLREHEKKALVLLSVFSDSFSNKSAQAVIKAGDFQHDPRSILHSLRKRSLIEDRGSYRYEIHQFIQTFAKKIDEANYSSVLKLQGEKAACTHFTSQLVDISACYWSKDKCKEAIHSFNTDRHNFENFFQIFIKKQENNMPRNKIWKILPFLKGQDSQLKKTMEELVKKISQTCTFLEMCIQPGDYLRYLIELDQLFMSHQQPVTKRVELLCLLGHEYRKIGDKDKYKESIEKAADLHSNHPKEFDNEKVSEAFFRNNYARFLSDGKNCSKAEEQFIKSLEACDQQKPMDFVQKGISLLYAGRNYKKQNERDQAEAKFNTSFKIFEENLGCHIMTALLLNEIADFHLFHGEKRLGSATDQCKSIKLYEKALEMMKSVGIEEQKECILPLTNLGVCYQFQGKMEDAKSLFQASLGIAKDKLTENHRWKIYAMTQMAFWFKKNGNPEKAKEWKQEALTMSNTLQLPDDQPPNKFLLDKI